MKGARITILIGATFMAVWLLLAVAGASGSVPTSGHIGWLFLIGIVLVIAGIVKYKKTKAMDERLQRARDEETAQRNR